MNGAEPATTEVKQAQCHPEPSHEPNIDQSFWVDWIRSRDRCKEPVYTHTLSVREEIFGFGRVMDSITPINKASGCGTSPTCVASTNAASCNGVSPYWIVGVNAAHRCWGSPTCTSRQHTTSAASSKFTGCCREEVINSSPHIVIELLTTPLESTATLPVVIVKQSTVPTQNWVASWMQPTAPP